MELCGRGPDASSSGPQEGFPRRIRPCRYDGSSVPRSVSFLLIFAIALTLPAAAQAQTTDTPGDPVAVIKVEGAIDRPLTGYLEAQIDQAVGDDAVIVLQLVSAGSIGRDGVALAQQLVGLPVPVLVWVGAVPARASGAGMLLTETTARAGGGPGPPGGPL